MSGSSNYQPDNRELELAVRAVELSINTESHKYAVFRLRELREQRTTWVGVEELNLRAKIDRTLSACDAIRII